jgi:hypothetical protein
MFNYSYRFIIVSSSITLLSDSDQSLQFCLPFSLLDTVAWPFGRLEWVRKFQHVQ